ncbi:MAG TPA: hypothetical protein VH914_03225 [Acidimicrobiia bacterium]|jgi:hypothetical protein|nr:hypothetical protein [Acidimicrobiia bacterium]
MIAASVLHDFANRQEFHEGLRWGVALAAVSVVAGVICTSVFRKPAPIAGLVVTIAFASAVTPARAVSIDGFGRTGLPSNVGHGLVYLGIAGLVVGLLMMWQRALVLVGLVVTIPGAVLLTQKSGLPNEHWVAPLVVLTTVVGGTLVADFDRRHRRRGWGPVMFAVTVVGMYFTVPDTEVALVLLGASLPLVLLGWPVPLTSIGAVGAYPAVGALAWTAAYEGLGRPSAIVAGVACLGLFVVEPVTRILLGFKRTIFDMLPRRWWLAIPVAVGHLVLVFVAARVAGLRQDVGQATLIVVAELVSAVAVLWAIQAEALPQPRRRSVPR